MRHPLRRLVAPLAFALALVASGCSSSSGTSPPTTSGGTGSDGGTDVCSPGRACTSCAGGTPSCTVTTAPCTLSPSDTAFVCANANNALFRCGGYYVSEIQGTDTIVAEAYDAATGELVARELTGPCGCACFGPTSFAFPDVKSTACTRIAAACDAGTG